MRALALDQVAEGLDQRQGFGRAIALRQTDREQPRSLEARPRRPEPAGNPYASCAAACLSGGQRPSAGERSCVQRGDALLQAARFARRLSTTSRPALPADEDQLALAGHRRNAPARRHGRSSRRAPVRGFDARDVRRAASAAAT
jgi:hypothetical protein